MDFGLYNTLWSEELHISTMQRYANAAFRDGLDIPTIRTLASLAAWGKHPSNAERDFHRARPNLHSCDFPTYKAAIEIYDPDEGMIKPIEVPVLLASTVLHELHKKNNRRLWATCIGATPEKTHKFWSDFRASSWDHPVLQPFGTNEWFSLLCFTLKCINGCILWVVEIDPQIIIWF